jgi:hypothetical protein
MNEKPDADEFDEDDADEVADSDPGLDHLLRDLDTHKRRGAARGQEPAWRRLEKHLEQKRTQELISDFEDYDIGEDEGAERRRSRPRKAGR